MWFYIFTIFSRCKVSSQSAKTPPLHSPHGNPRFTRHLYHGCANSGLAEAMTSEPAPLRDDPHQKAMLGLRPLEGSLHQLAHTEGLQDAAMQLACPKALPPSQPHVSRLLYSWKRNEQAAVGLALVQSFDRTLNRCGWLTSEEVPPSANYELPPTTPTASHQTSLTIRLRQYVRRSSFVSSAPFCRAPPLSCICSCFCQSR
jgi:hypothetical protein